MKQMNLFVLSRYVRCVKQSGIPTNHTLCLAVYKFIGESKFPEERARYMTNQHS